VTFPASALIFPGAKLAIFHILEEPKTEMSGERERLKVDFTTSEDVYLLNVGEYEGAQIVTPAQVLGIIKREEKT
jgi:hypothetical protein